MSQTKLKGEDVYDGSIKPIDCNFSAAEAKTPVANDGIIITDSVTNLIKKVTFSNMAIYVRSYLATYRSFQELASLGNTVAAGYKFMYAKAAGMFFKNSDGTSFQLIHATDKNVTNLPGRANIGTLLPINTLSNDEITMSVQSHVSINNLVLSGKKDWLLNIDRNEAVTINKTNLGVGNNAIPGYLFDGNNTTGVNIYSGTTSDATPAILEVLSTGNLIEYVYGQTFISFLIHAGYGAPGNLGTAQFNKWKFEIRGNSTGTWYTSIDRTGVNDYVNGLTFNVLNQSGIGSFTSTTFFTEGNRHITGFRLTLYQVTNISGESFIPLVRVLGHSFYMTEPADSVGALSSRGGKVYGDIDFAYNNNSGIKFNGAAVSGKFIKAESGRFVPGNIIDTDLPSETINFDASIEPTQTGTTSKTILWMLQYLSQGVKWLKNNPPTPSYCATAGDSDTLDTFDAVDIFRKTAFSQFDDIGSANPIHTYVLNDAEHSDLADSLSDIYALDTSPKVIILQAGVYNIFSAIDFSLLSILAMIGISKESTIINIGDVEDPLSNISLKNITLNLSPVTITGNIVYNSGEQNIKSVSVINNNLYTSFTAFKNCKNMSDIYVTGVLIALDGCNDFENLKIYNVEGDYTAGNYVMNGCKRGSNIEIIISHNQKGISNSSELSCIEINGSTIDENIAFYKCDNISNAKIFNFETAVSNCLSMININSDSCEIGFLGSSFLSACRALHGTTGFKSCTKISVSYADSMSGYGFEDCNGVVNNESHCTNKFSNSFSDSGSNACADTPAGGFNS